MRTPKQTQASRTNGARSKGPVTAQGKFNSSRNAIRHGLLAETVVLDEEDKDNFLQLLNELKDHHDPQNITECLLIESMAVARFRQYRIWEMQRVAFRHDVNTPNDALDTPVERATLALRGAPEVRLSHDLLLRYEVALDRMFSRALRRLTELKSNNSATAKGTQENTENKSKQTKPKCSNPTKIPENSMPPSPPTNRDRKEAHQAPKNTQNPSPRPPNSPPLG